MIERLSYMNYKVNYYQDFYEDLLTLLFATFFKNFWEVSVLYGVFFLDLLIRIPPYNMAAEVGFEPTPEVLETPALNHYATPQYILKTQNHGKKLKIKLFYILKINC